MWRVEHDPERAFLELRARRVLSLADVEHMALEWARALAATAGQATVALFDLRGLEPLEGDAVVRLRDLVKRPALDRPNVVRIVTIVDSATGALQQRHAILDPAREALTQSEQEARQLLETPVG